MDSSHILLTSSPTKVLLLVITIGNMWRNIAFTFQNAVICYGKLGCEHERSNTNNHSGEVHNQDIYVTVQGCFAGGG